MEFKEVIQAVVSQFSVSEMAELDINLDLPEHTSLSITIRRHPMVIPDRMIETGGK